MSLFIVPAAVRGFFGQMSRRALRLMAQVHAAPCRRRDRENSLGDQRANTRPHYVHGLAVGRRFGKQTWNHVVVRINHVCEVLLDALTSIRTTLLTDMTLRRFGISACTVNPEGLPPSLIRHGWC